tara:strand:+ start:379 stop:486 length:108 start_codon:yes stop_codon:yes gene_type:complete
VNAPSVGEKNGSLIGKASNIALGDVETREKGAEFK